jgi:type II secretory pathway pseudopilin PulG
MSFRPHAHAARVRAFSLITVLAALAIMSLLLLALLASASHQVRSGQNDASLERERMLADTAVSLVIGQIGQATTQPNQAWISQPGLIRTYAATSARTPAASYKLYSAPQMIDTSGSLAFLATDVPPDWNSTANQNVYTDLNAPLEPLFGSPIYPILDVNAVTPGSSQVPGLSSDTNSVQMPVAWIYELQDGTLGTPSTATASNPIVGRIAFWTDDETSKIDINTAGEARPGTRRARIPPTTRTLPRCNPPAGNSSVTRAIPPRSRSACSSARAQRQGWRRTRCSPSRRATTQAVRSSARCPPRRQAW